MQGTSMIDGGQLFVRREDGSSLVIGVTAPESLTVAGLLHLVEERTGDSARNQRLVYAGYQLAPERSFAHYDISSGATLHMLQGLRGGMPASAGRVRMPANNRMHSSAALRTTDMWSSVIGNDFGKANDAGAVSGAGAQGANAYEMSQNLLALARLSGASKGAVNRGACKKCGEIGHLAFQCFNMLLGKKLQAGDVSSTSSSDLEEEEERERKRSRSMSSVSSTTSEDEKEAKDKARDLEAKDKARDLVKRKPDLDVAKCIYVDKDRDKRQKVEKKSKKDKKDKKSKDKKKKKDKKSRKDKKSKKSKKV